MHICRNLRLFVATREARQLDYPYANELLLLNLDYIPESLGNCRGLRLASRGSLVEGRLSRVACRGS